MEFLLEYEPLFWFTLILGCTYFIGIWFSRFFNKFILSSTAVLQSDPTNFQFLRHIIKAIIYIVGIMFAINSVPALKAFSTSILAGAGVLAVAVGFASQKAVANIIGGLFLIMFKPFRVNQIITVDNNITGVVEDITLRHTVVRNFENKRIIIPNSNISEQIIINASTVDEKICCLYEVGVAYDTDLDLAIKTLREEAEAHPLTLDHRTQEQLSENQPIVRIKVISLGNYQINLRAWIWANNSGEAFELKCDLNKSIVERFRKEQIKIPYPHSTLTIKNSPDL